MGMYFFIKSLRFFVGSFDEVVGEILKKMHLRKTFIVLPCDLHNLAVVSLYPSLQRVYDAVDFCATDGMPLVWWARQQTRRKIDRVYGPDLTKRILLATQGKKFRHAYCGFSSSEMHKLTNGMLRLAPKLNIVCTVSPRIERHKTKEEVESLRLLVKSKPTTIWIGISSPAQVVLAARWKKYFPQAAIFCVGAAFDVISESVKVAPVWLQSIGFEWLFRLIVEPRRLHKRYLYVVPKFLFQEAIRWITR